MSGFGGQGLITAGIILAEAALKDHRQAVQTQSYGPEARGGASKSEVIISDGVIDYPKVTRPHILLVMSQEACDKYESDLVPQGVLIADSTYVQAVGETPGRVFSLPLTAAVRERLGKVIVANITALGAIIGLTGVVTRLALEQAVMARVPRGTEELNRQALDLGLQLARDNQEQAPGRGQY